MSDQPIDIRPDHEALVRDILRARLPKDVRVWAFGSRATWKAKQYSDLDLALEAETAEPLPAALIHDLADDFEESDLPWKVDMLDLNAIAPSFQAMIDKDKVVFSLGGKVMDGRNARSIRSGMAAGRCRSAIREIGIMRFDDIAELNPKVSLKKGETATFLDMSALPQNARDIAEASERLFKGAGSKFQNGDTLIARITPCLENGKGALVNCLDGADIAFGSTEFIVARAKNMADQRFIYYVTRNEAFRDVAISRMEGTSGRQRVSWQQIASIEVPYLAPSERESIASVLGALDDKIELNRRMNETLEAMARAIFKSWFVDFDPVRAKMAGNPPAHMAAKTAALFPCSFGDNGLPEGWKIKPLDEVADFLNGAALQKFPADGSDFLPVIKIAELRNGISSNTNRASMDVPEKYVIFDGDVLFAWSGSLMQKVWTEGKGALNQHLFKVTSENYAKWFFYYWVDHHMKSFQSIAASKATTMGHIQRKHLTEAQVVLPDNAVLETGSKYIAPLLEKQTQNSLENQTLAQLRDTLLPKLMSGEIRVKDAKKERQWRYD